MPQSANEWLDRVFDWVERNEKTLLMIGGLIVVSRMFRLKIGLGKG